MLESLDVASYDHVIVLAYKETLDPQRADAKTLITLLHLRDMADRAGVDLTVVSEMLDDRNRELAEVTQADDFIVSDKLISLMLSQISENKQLTEVFDQLFSSEGSEIYLRPADSLHPRRGGASTSTPCRGRPSRGRDRDRLPDRRARAQQRALATASR